MDYFRAVMFVLSLLVCCIIFSGLAALTAIVNPLMLMLLFGVGLLGILMVLDFLESPFKSRY